MNDMLRKWISPITGSAIFLFLAPGIIAGLIPWWISGWQVQAPPLGVEALRWSGVLPIALGGVLLLEAFTRFALQGKGTPAPIYPTAELVVTGSYRFVRNPMYVAVVAIILGQALLFGNVELLLYGAVIWGFVHAFVVSYEEPVLRRTFGASYEAYCAGVRRWLPRLTPWTSKFGSVAS